MTIHKHWCAECGARIGEGDDGCCGSKLCRAKVKHARLGATRWHSKEVVLEDARRIARGLLVTNPKGAPLVALQKELALHPYDDASDFRKRLDAIIDTGKDPGASRPEGVFDASRKISQPTTAQIFKAMEEAGRNASLYADRMMRDAIMAGAGFERSEGGAPEPDWNVTMPGQERAPDNRNGYPICFTRAHARALFAEHPTNGKLVEHAIEFASGEALDEIGQRFGVLRASNGVARPGGGGCLVFEDDHKFRHRILEAKRGAARRPEFAVDAVPSRMASDGRYYWAMGTEDHARLVIEHLGGVQMLEKRHVTFASGEALDVIGAHYNLPRARVYKVRQNGDSAVEVEQDFSFRERILRARGIKPGDEVELRGPNAIETRVVKRAGDLSGTSGKHLDDVGNTNNIPRWPGEHDFEYRSRVQMILQSRQQS